MFHSGYKDGSQAAATSGVELTAALPAKPREFAFRDPLPLRGAEEEIARVSSTNNFFLIRDTVDKARGLDEVAADPATPMLCFTAELWNEVQYITRKNPNNEYAAFLVIRPVDGVRPHFLAHDMFMPGQQVSSAGANLDGADCDRYFARLKEDARLAELGLHRSLCHLHSHAGMGTFWSGTDNTQQLTHEDLGFMDDYRFYCVVNTKGSIKCSFVAYRPVLFRVDAAVAISCSCPEHIRPLTVGRKKELDAMLQDALDISRPVVSISSMTGRTGQTGWTGGTDWTGRTGLTDWTGGTGAAARWQDYVPYGRTGRRTGHPKEREASGADAKPGSHEADADPGNPGLAVHWNPEKDGNIHDFPPAPPEVVDRFFRRLERSPEYRDAVRRTRAAVGGQEADFADVLAESLQSPPLESSDPRLLALASLFVDALEAGEDAFLMPDGEKRDGILMVEAMRAVPEYVWALMYAAWLSGTDRAPEYAEEALRELDEETCRALFPSEETVRAICHDVRFLADCLHADVARWLSWFFEELEDEAREAGHATEL